MSGIIGFLGLLLISIGNNNLVLPEKKQIQNFENKKTISNEDLKKNNFTLINFWASWCAPCRVEHPVLLELSKEKNLKIFVKHKEISKKKV